MCCLRFIVFLQLFVCALCLRNDENVCFTEERLVLTSIGLVWGQIQGIHSESMCVAVHFHGRHMPWNTIILNTFLCIEKLMNRFLYETFSRYVEVERVKTTQPVQVRSYNWCLSYPPRCTNYRTEIKEVFKLQVGIAHSKGLHNIFFFARACGYSAMYMILKHVIM